MSHQNCNITDLGGKLEQDATEQVINKTITIQTVEILYATI
jgi:predicted metal-binding protein